MKTKADSMINGGDNFTNAMVNMALRQMGDDAKIISTPGRINRVRFSITDKVHVNYVYELKQGSPIYIHRMSPYPIFLGTAKDEWELLAIIGRDYSRFKNAYKDGQLEDYIYITEEADKINTIIDEMFHDTLTKEYLQEFVGYIEECLGQLTVLRDNYEAGLLDKEKKEETNPETER